MNLTFCEILLFIFRNVGYTDF